MTSSPAISSQGVVFICSDDSYAYAFNETTGALIWRSEGLHFAMSLPALSPDESVIYSGTGGRDNGILYGLFTVDGSRAFAADSQSNAITSSPTLGLDGTVYFTADQLIFAVASNSTPLWQRKVPGVGNNDLSPALDDRSGLLYVYGEDVLALHTGNGSVAWKFPTGSGGSAEMALDSAGHLYAGAGNGVVYCLNATTGAYLSNYTSPTHNEIYSMAITPPTEDCASAL